MVHWPHAKKNGILARAPRLYNMLSCVGENSFFSVTTWFTFFCFHSKDGRQRIKRHIQGPSPRWRQQKLPIIWSSAIRWGNREWPIGCAIEATAQVATSTDDRDWRLVPGSHMFAHSLTVSSYRNYRSWFACELWKCIVRRWTCRSFDKFFTGRHYCLFRYVWGLNYGISWNDANFHRQSLGEMATLIPVTGSFTEYAERFIDDSLAFALGWAYWYLWVTVSIQWTQTRTNWSLIRCNI